MEIRDALAISVQTGFLDKNIASDKIFRPELLTNDAENDKNVLSSIEKELETCNEFWISVAFITTSGVAALIQTLDEIEKRNIKGKVLTSAYLYFTQPEALRKIKQLSNIELRMATEINFHSKGYLFERKGLCNLIIGSSNLTASALKVNKEWNLKVSATSDSELIESVKDEFRNVFESSQPVTLDFIKIYEKDYIEKKKVNDVLNENLLLGSKSDIRPNLMQKEALENIEAMRKAGNKKALLISATGTGKTYLSAFDVRNFKPKTFLFVVHRNTIAKKAKKSFETILEDKISFGIFSGSKKELQSDYLFSTIQTISKDENLELFDPKHFDYIVIDETHRAGAASYKKLMDYFEPKFLLGMTATPERTDGVDIMSLFDHNIAYEIRLHRALEEKMLVPFHYYGVTDLSINDEEITELSDFNILTANERVKRIIEKSRFYGTDDGKVRGLIFCSRKIESEALSEEFNKQGYRTISLTGGSSNEDRIKAIERLESDDENLKLDYIFSVDIFNEGVDIPKCNQIIMLRPTQSAIIFIQQLGRGLRLESGKEYLTVIDFIGNYSNNYLVPIALFGDISFNKDTLRKLMSAGSRLMPGSSTINFDRIAKEKIFHAIDKANLNKRKDLLNDYQLLKFRLGRIPMMLDFLNNNSRDPQTFVDYKPSGSFYNFVSNIAKEDVPVVSKKGRLLLEYFSKEVNNGVRMEESFLLFEMVKNGPLTLKKARHKFNKRYGYTLTDNNIESAIRNINLLYVSTKLNGITGFIGDLFKLKVLYIDNGTLVFEKEFLKELDNATFRKFLLDSIAVSIKKVENKLKLKDLRSFFILNTKYSRKDIFRILNWKKNPNPQNVGGYIFDEVNMMCPVFINYKKAEDISDTTNYNDKFLSPTEMQWESKSNRKLDSKDGIRILSGNYSFPLFVRKHDGEGADFYFLGYSKVIKDRTVQAIQEDDKKLPVIRFVLKLDDPVKSELYDYITT